VAFDQRGCLSPRIVFVEGDLDRAVSFGEVLHASLSHFERVVPRGALSTEERAESERYVATMTYAHRALVGAAHVVGIAALGAPLLLPPTYRHVHVVAAADAATACTLLAPIVRGVVAVSSDDEAAARRLGPPWARISAVGSMQRPPLDGPVDLRETFSGARLSS
jgi:hypothetical protein